LGRGGIVVCFVVW